MHPGSRITGTVHYDDHELVVIMKGRPRIDVEGHTIYGTPGMIVNVPVSTSHSYVPMDDELVEMLAIYRPD
jgi:mannose-6-phosphate isomerase-like protein (cupin superfamily)